MQINPIVEARLSILERDNAELKARLQRLEELVSQRPSQSAEAGSPVDSPVSR